MTAHEDNSIPSARMAANIAHSVGLLAALNEQ
jgi:hypothetical protein